MYPPQTYARLARIKRIYDPDNRFALNHNIDPSRGNGPGADHHRLSEHPRGSVSGHAAGCSRA